MPGNKRLIDVPQAYAMIKQGVSVHGIAAQFGPNGVSHVAVINALKRAGLPASALAYRRAEAAGTLPPDPTTAREGKPPGEPS